MKYGKIVEEKLVIAGRVIIEDKTKITNPTEKQLKEYGYKEVEYTEKPTYDKDNEKLVETYREDIEQTTILVCYDIVALTEEEKKENLKNKVSDLEYEYNMCRWQREIILAENSGASDYTKTKAKEIENLAKGLR